MVLVHFDVSYEGAFPAQSRRKQSFITIIVTIAMTIVSVVNAIEIVLVFLVRWFPYHSKPPEPLNHHLISRSIGGMSWVTLEMVVQYLCAFSAVMAILDVTPQAQYTCDTN